MTKFLKISFLICISAFLMSCASNTAHIPPVKNFEPLKYMGTWHEIIRLPHSFEDGLTNVTATYKVREDGKISVVNKGYKEATGKWTSIEGYAYFKGDKSTGDLEVVFFWPFAGDYKIIYLDDEYRFAVVTSSRMSYFWLLSREEKPDRETIDKFTAMAKAWGFDTDKFILLPAKP